MALDIVKGGDFVEITPDAATNYDSQTSFPVGMFLQSIEFVPSADGDILKVREGSAAGPIICRIKGTDGDKKKYFNRALSKPFIKAADLILTTPANARVIIQYG
jgi:hypothetical protein